MTIYINIRPSEISTTRKLTLTMQDSFSKLDKSKGKFKILEREKQERINDIRTNFNYVQELLEKIEMGLPRAESPYLHTKLTEKGLSIQPILEIKSEKDYLIDLKNISRELKGKRKK